MNLKINEGFYNGSAIIMDKKIEIVHVGTPGFPFGSAAVNRCLGIYSILPHNEFNVLVINNKAVHQSDVYLNKKGKHSNVYYQYTTPSPYKPNGFFKRRHYKLIGRINEFIILFKLGLNKKIDIMFFYPQGNFFELINYRFLSKLFGFSLISHYVEYRTSFKSRNKAWLRINDFLFDKYFVFLIDGCIPISDFLIDQIKESGRNLPYIKIPPVVNFNLFNKHKNINSTKYFLYVGTTEYFQTITMILDAFKLVENNDYYLFLIIKGSKMKLIKDKIKKHPKNKSIKVFTNLEYSELIQYFINARALLIPLSNSIQDKARFPNKISEYLASANPIITTSFGEVENYFTDGVNALVSKKNDSVSLSEKMIYIINNPEKAKEIGINGYNIGLKYFDNNNYKNTIRHFLLKLYHN